jgi:hypothetical protein
MFSRIHAVIKQSLNGSYLEGTAKITLRDLHCFSANSWRRDFCPSPSKYFPLTTKLVKSSGRENLWKGIQQKS